jgi:hypothetical protein
MTANRDDQRRIDNAIHLKGLRLQRRRYNRWSESSDHDHCVACGPKFSELEGAESQREGYATREDYPKGAGYEWVCQTCLKT